MKIIQYLISGIFLFFLSSLLSAQQSTKQDTLRELWRRIDILTQELERAKLGTVAEAKYESRYGMGPAASSVYNLTDPGISIAGYGASTKIFPDNRTMAFLPARQTLLIS